MSIFGTSVVSSNAGGPATAYTTTAPLNTAAGDLLIVGVAINDNTKTLDTPTDLAGNTFIPLTLRNIVAKGWKMQFFYCIGAIANAANIVSGTISSGGGAASYNIVVWDIPLSGSATFDTEATFDPSFDANTVPFSTAGTDEFVGVFSTDAWGGWNYTVGAGYTLDVVSMAPNNVGAAEHQVFAAPQVGIVASFGNHPPSGAAAIAVAFMAGGTPPPPSGGSGNQNVFTTEVFGAEVITAAGTVFGTTTRTRMGK